MKKIIPVPFPKALNKGRKDHSQSPGLCFLRGGIIFIFLFQLATPNAAASVDEPDSDRQAFEIQTAEQDIREMKPGETVERKTNGKEIHGYRIILETGTAVEINIGKRDTPIQLIATVPDNMDFSVPGQKIPTGSELARVVAGPGEELVEPMMIVAEKTGSYIIAAHFLGPGTYSISFSPARATTERDRRYAAAGKLFAEIRRSYENGEPSWKMHDQIEKRAAIYRSLGDKKSLALSLNDLGISYGSKGEWANALRSVREALEIFRSLNAAANISKNLWLVGTASQRVSDFQESVDSYLEILSLSRAAGNKMDEAGALHQLGVVYHLLADELKAREYYEQSLLVKKSITPVTANLLNGLAVTLINIGNLYRGVEANELLMDAFGPRTADDRRKALEYYKQALELALRTKKEFPGARTRELYSLLQIGNTYKELGNYAEALAYLNQALENYISVKSAPGQIYCLMGLGNLYALKGEYPKSFENYERAMELLRGGADNAYHANYLNLIARDYYRAGETRKALEILGEALTLSRSRQQPMVSTESLYETARIERDLGNFNNARNRIEEAIQTAESLRAGMTSQEIRTIYFSSVKRYYDFYIDLLMQAHKSQPEKGFDLLALQMSEKARSRSLLDLLTLSRIDIKQGVEPALLEREESVRQRLAEKANQQSRLLLGKHTDEEAQKIKNEISALTEEYQTVQSEIKNKSPRYAALTQPTPLDTKQIQRLLDSGTVLLEYTLGEKKSYLWAVSADSVTSFDLPPRGEIETQARKVYQLLTARNQSPKGETDEQKRARVKTAEDEYPKAAAELSRMLIAPVASQIGNKRLLIVADGALNYIPFSALLLENANSSPPLGTNHEIITLPSASILAVLREETGNRKPAPKMLAIFADPVFNQTDVRFNAAVAKQNKTKQLNEISQLNNQIEKPSYSRDFERALSGSGLILGDSGGLPRLPFSRREADSIFKDSPKNLSLKRVEFEASKANVFNSSLEQYRILHFATHGLLNSQHPELSGIVLSLVDKSGGEIDGFVRLQDIYNLKLSADLVVLSACQTALGKDVKSEGLISLTRGFMYAGAPRVVASLWKVDDAATAELMSVFYRKMLVENLRPAAALRAAQAEMMKQTRWKSPYYWAGFVIQGEWR